MKNSIPIIIGVTGHRDLIENSINTLKTKVKFILNKYKKSYSPADIIILTALAEGADMLVAEVAKELGLKLHIAIPYDENDYLNSFIKNESKKIFQELKFYATDFKTLPCKYIQNGDDCYKKLGEYIVDNSNVLLALWDGIVNGKKGGTSCVIQYAKKSFTKKQLDEKSIVIINTPRISSEKLLTNP